MLVDKNYKIKYNYKSSKYYTEKGYKLYKQEFEVNAKDIRPESNIVVEYVCDYCKSIHELPYAVYMRRKESLKGNDFCENCVKYYLQNELTLFIKTYNYVPSMRELLKSCNNTYEIFKNIYHNINQVIKDINFNVFDFYIIKFKQEYQNGNIKKYHDLSWERFKIPRIKWFINNCPNNIIKDFNGLLEYCNIKPNKHTSKEFAIKLIYNMQSKLDRPLMQCDFKNPKPNEIGNSTINKYWGSLNKMKEELGLEIVQEDMTKKSRDISELKKDIIRLCNEIYIKENRKIITLTDINKSEYCLSSGYYTKHFKQNNISFREFLQSLGFELQKAGNGLNYTYEDGEKVKSQYELDFSNLLREYSLIFNKDYFREVRYKTFIKDYNKLMDCDYVIHYNNEMIYVEIVGMLRDYKNNLINNIPITTSKSKEKYRKSLTKKETMLKENGLTYYLLFPDDINSEKLNTIFTKSHVNKLKINIR